MCAPFFIMELSDYHVFPFSNCPSWVNQWLLTQSWINEFSKKMKPYTSPLASTSIDQDYQNLVHKQAVIFGEELAGYPVFIQKDHQLFIVIKNSPEVTMAILQQ